MKDIGAIKRVLEFEKENLREQFAVEKIKIFGSFARGQQKETSDLDLLVDFDRMVGLMKLAELQFYLEERLGLKVDIATRRALKPYMSTHILREAIPV